MKIVGRGGELSVARPPPPRPQNFKRRRQPGEVIPGNHKKEK